MVEIVKSKVSILMNTYNSDKFIKESINSVLNQSYKKLELVIYDNCSSDLTQKIVKSFNHLKIKELNIF